MPPSQISLYWSIFSVVATLIGFYVDVKALLEIWQGAGPNRLWGLALVISLMLWIGAWYNRQLTLAPIILWAIPALIVCGVIGYGVWRLIPPKRTVVLVADLVDSEGRDSRLLTDTLVQEMRDTLADHDSIVVRRLNRPITGEKGTTHARRIARHPSYKAAYVIWGQYTVAGGELKLLAHFELLRDVHPLGQRLDLIYGQVLQGATIAEPKLFHFEVALGRHMSHLTAFAAALALFEDGNNKAAEPFFDTACLALEAPLGAEMAQALRFYRGTNYGILGRAARAALDLRFLMPDLDTPAEDWDDFALDALNNLGLVAMHQSDYDAARDYLQHALDLYTQLSNPRGQAMSFNNLGIVAGDQGDYNTAHDYHQRALDLFIQLGNSSGQAASLGNLGIVAAHQDDYDAARDYLQHALDLHAKCGHPLGQAKSFGSLGNVARDQGDYDAAHDYHQRALDLFIQLGNSSGQAASLGNLGNVVMDQGDYAAARNYLQRALDLLIQLDNPSSKVKAFDNLGDVAMHQGDYAAARDYCQRALDLYTQLGNPLGQARSLGNLGGVAVHQGDYAAARDYLQRALDLYAQLGNPSGQARNLGNLGLLAEREGQHHEACDLLSRSVALYRDMGLPVPGSFTAALARLGCDES